MANNFYKYKSYNIDYRYKYTDYTIVIKIIMKNILTMLPLTIIILLH